MVIGPDGCGFDMRSPSEMEADDARREADEAAHAPRMAVTSRIRRVAQPVLLQCLFDRFGSVFPQCGLMVFPGAVIVSR